VLIEGPIPYIDANFRTIADRKARAIDGFSMGGLGSLQTSLCIDHGFSISSPEVPDYYPLVLDRVPFDPLAFWRDFFAKLNYKDMFAGENCADSLIETFVAGEINDLAEAMA
jgi:hypothetical protein